MKEEYYVKKRMVHDDLSNFKFKIVGKANKKITST